MRIIYLLSSICIIILLCGCDNRKVKKIYDNGCLRSEEVYKDKKLIMKILYDKKGNQKQHIKYKNGKIFEIRFFNEGGRLRAFIPYVDGIENGPATGYYNDGKLYSKVNYKSGRLDGKAYLFYPDGSILLDYGYKFKKGDPDVPAYRDGDYIYYDKKGRIISKGIFKHEKPWEGTFLSKYKSGVGEVFAGSTLLYILKYEKGRLISSTPLETPFYIQT